MLGLNTSAPNVLSGTTGGSGPTVVGGLFSSSSNATGPSASFLNSLGNERLSFNSATLLGYNAAPPVLPPNSTSSSSSSASAQNTNPLSFNLQNTSNSNMNVSGNNSAFTPTNPNGGATNTFAQPASPMDTSTCKD